MVANQDKEIANLKKENSIFKEENAILKNEIFNLKKELNNLVVNSQKIKGKKHFCYSHKNRVSMIFCS